MTLIRLCRPAGGQDYADATVMPTVAAAAVDAIGAYALLRQTTTSTARSPGDISGGANLRYESVAGNGAGGAPPGNWMICGAITRRWQHDQHLAVAAGFVG